MFLHKIDIIDIKGNRIPLFCLPTWPLSHSHAKSLLKIQYNVLKGLKNEKSKKNVLKNKIQCTFLQWPCVVYNNYLTQRKLTF